jgi:hypothetical protein
MELIQQITSIASLLAQVVITYFIYSRLKNLKEVESDLSFLVALSLSIFGINLLHLAFLTASFSNFVFHLVVSSAGIGLCIVFVRDKHLSIKIRKSLYGGFAYLPILLLMAIQLIVNFFKVEWSIDGMLYHGPTLGNLMSNQSIWQFDSLNQYQYYSDLTMVGATTLASITPIVRLDDAAQVPYMLILAASISAILSLRVKSRSLRIAIATLILTSPVVWLQPRILYVDLAYASSIAAVVTLIMFLNPRNISYVLALGCAIGSLVATKPSGIPIGILVTLFASIYILKRDFTRASPALFVALYLPIFLGLMFYVRNYVQFSNPLYPVAWNLGPLNFNGPIGVDAFTSRGGTEGGLIDFSRILDFVSNLLSGASNGVTKLDYDPRTGGFSYTILVIPFLLAISLLNRLVTGKSIEDRGQLAKPTLILVVATLITLLFQPASTDSRYVIAPFALTVCAFILVMPRIPLQSILTPLILLASVFSMIWVEKNMFMGIKSLNINLAANIKSILPGGQEPTLDPGNGFSWLPKDDCVKVAIQSEGGVNENGMAELTRQNTLSYGYFGNKLCNDLTIVIAPKDENTDFDSEVRELAEINELKFIAVYTDELEKWVTSFTKVGLKAEELVQVLGDAEYPTDMSILEIN